MSFKKNIHNKLLSEKKIFSYRFLRFFDVVDNFLFSRHKAPPIIINKLREIGCDETSHMNRDLLNHFQGTYRLLRKWNNNESVCLAGLCHAIYGTETFSSNLVPLKNRQKIANLIGSEAEQLSFYYSIINRKDFTESLNNKDNLKIKSHSSSKIISITELEFKQLVETFLADRLEQIFFLNYRYRYQYKSFFIKAKHYISRQGFQEFLIAYDIRENHESLD